MKKPSKQTVLNLLLGYFILDVIATSVLMAIRHKKAKALRQPVLTPAQKLFKSMMRRKITSFHIEGGPNPKMEVIQNGNANSPTITKEEIQLAVDEIVKQYAGTEFAKGKPLEISAHAKTKIFLYGIESSPIVVGSIEY